MAAVALKCLATHSGANKILQTACRTSPQEYERPSTILITHTQIQKARKTTGNFRSWNQACF